MRISHDQRMIARAIQKLQMQEIMNIEGLPFVYLTYEKGEIITAPDKPIRYLLFCTKGHAKIYNLREDSSFLPVASFGPGTFIGDIEFSGISATTSYVEAVTKMEFLGLDIELNRNRLEGDARFLRFLVRTLAMKLELSLQTSNPSENIRERLFVYFEKYCKDGWLRHIEAVTMNLRCSRRQLQRVLLQMCEEGILVREAKGAYRIVQKSTGHDQ